MPRQSKDAPLYAKTYERGHEIAIWHNGTQTQAEVLANSELYIYPQAYVCGYKAAMRENSIILPS